MWKWLPATQTNLLAYDQLRYRMLPYNYSVAWKITSEHYTPMRPLLMDFPQDGQALPVGDEYMFGPAFLVSPVTTAQATSRPVYLPAGTKWVDFWSGETVTGGTTVTANAPLNILPLEVRAGSIVPLGPVMQYATEQPADPMELRVYRGADGKFTLYEDEGDSYAYEKGAGATIQFAWDERKQTLTIGKLAGSFPGMLKERTIRVVFVSPGHGTGMATEEKADAVVHYTGKSVTVSGKK
jgi:alpha-D-xyloside xylohydrolase